MTWPRSVSAVSAPTGARADGRALALGSSALRVSALTDVFAWRAASAYTTPERLTDPEADLACEPAVTTRRPNAAIAPRDSRQLREEAAALRAESRQARRRTHSLRKDSNAILDAAIAITEEVLAQRRIALVEPVAAKFTTDDVSTGIEITIWLTDSTRAVAVQRALIERFGGEARCDRLIVR
jgi:hypothetical protein